MKLSIEEKVELLDGLDVWHTKPIGSLPSIMMADGPHGLRKQIESTDNLGVKGSLPATCFPTASLVACSFDEDVLKLMGETIAKEAIAQGVQIVLGPGINMKRSPLCGRNFEYFSEDPHLTGELASAYVKAVESLGIGTSVKHFFANNQEKHRFYVDSCVDERALREIYLKAFERVVKEQPATIMASYNKINGTYATEHPYISKMLRKEWGYKGIVVSDWGAVHDRIASIKAGCDLEMPTSFGYRTKQVLDAIANDENLRLAITRSSDRMIEFAKKYKKQLEVPFDPKAHHEIARKIASESMVLLKNENILPLDSKEKVALIGGFAETMRYQGGGSSHVNPTFVSHLKDIYPNYSQHITYAKGYHLDHEKNDESLIDEAIEIAKESDKVIYVMGLPEYMETEGFDRSDIHIPYHQVHLLELLHEANPNIIIVMISGSVVDLSCDRFAKGLLQAYLGGQASSEAILDILYGKVNPSGRLAETFIHDMESCNVKLTDDNHSVHYEESIFIGYRYYNSFNVKVKYPFGYGLSYTTFDYKTVLLDEKKDHFLIDIIIKNTGAVKGKEVIQVYIENNEGSVYKTKRELRAFKKVELEPQEEKRVQIKLDKSSFAHYDIYKKQYLIEKGNYQILLCSDVNHDIESMDVFVDGEELHHPSISYQKYIYDPSDFPKVYSRKLPPKHMKKKRPYTLSSTLEDARETWVGRLVARMVIREGLKTARQMQDAWMLEVAKKTMLETPIHMLALFSAGKFTFTQAEGLVDMMNLKLIKGIRKLKKGQKA